MAADLTQALEAHIAELEVRLSQSSRHRAEAEARLQRFEKALDTMQLGVTITDVEGRIVYTNPSDARMHGYEVEETLGRDIGIFACPVDRTQVDPAQMRSMTSWQRESNNRRKDGSVFPVELLSDVVIDSDGVPLGIVTACQDITARREVEQRLQESHDAMDHTLLAQAAELVVANKRLLKESAEHKRTESERQALEAQLRQSQKLEGIGQLTGGIAHDFNNLLSVVLANAELLMETIGEDQTALRAAVRDIAAAGQSGARMVTQLLGFSRQAELNPIATDLRELVAQTSEMLVRIIREDISIRTSLRGPVGTVMADPGAVQQMLINLTTNARDALPEGGAVHIELSSEHFVEATRADHPWVKSGKYVSIAVTDNGIGMDEETRRKIFDPFFTTKPQGKGTGLGMATIYGLVKQHQGFVNVHSVLGEGTTVRLYFPVVDAPVARPAARAVEAAALPTGTETILLVEDEDALRSTGRRALERFGYSVLVASDGAEALSIFRAHRKDVSLILADLVMPRMSGWELYRAVRQEDDHVAFLFASGHTAADLRARGSLDANVPFLKKPWTLGELAQQVRTVLDRGEEVDLGE